MVKLRRISYCVLALLSALALGEVQPAAGQIAGGIQGGGVQGGGGLQGNVQGGGAAAGIKIDAQGVVTAGFRREPTGRLDKKRMSAVSREMLSADVNAPSPLRKVSLVRLETACDEYAADARNVPAEMHYLAGLQRIDYVFVYPESGDVVIAGPAGGFAPDLSGRMLGLETGRPVLRLDDLIVALRSQERGGTVGCSIDPQPENLAALQRFLAQNSKAATPALISARFKKMAQILGLQDVRVLGVPAESHFAEVLVEADVRMKRISIGLEQTNVRGLRSHLSMLRGGGNSMQRWWFTPLYDGLYRNEERTAFELRGQRAQLLAQEELPDAAGNRVDASTTRLSTRAFAKLFTEKFPELAARAPVFAELQNLTDLVVLAALLKQERIPEQIAWSRSLFLDTERATYVKGRVPRKAPTSVNFRRVRSGLIIGLVAGGVSLDGQQFLRSAPFQADSDRRLGPLHEASAATEPPEAHPWWWD